MKIDREESPRKVLLRIYPRFQGNDLVVTCAIAGETHIGRGGKVELQVIRGDTGAIEGQRGGPQKVIMRRIIRKLIPGVSEEVTFPLSKIPVSEWCIRAVFIDRYRHRCHTQTVQHKLMQKPDWFGSDEGVSHKVPAPWTPIETVSTSKGLLVECWGRKYKFNRGSFVEEILSAQKPLLAGPIRITGEVNGHKIRWLQSSFQCVSHESDQVVLSQESRGNRVTLRAMTEIDFDGMVRIDWELSAHKQVQINALTMEISIRKEIAKYFYQYRGYCGDDRKFGRIPANGFSKGFRPLIWVGNEERGLAWFAESSENWFNIDPGNAITLRREKNAVILRLHLISMPVDMLYSEGPDSPYSDRKPPLVRSLRWTFGLQATPVKPVEKDAWDYRIMCIGADAVQQKPLKVPDSLLDRLVTAGIRTVVIFEYWTDIEAHAVTTHGRELKTIVRACHERGLKVLLYFGFLFSELAPEWRDFGAQCVVLPRTGWAFYNYPPQPFQTAWRVCLRSPWQDFVVNGIAKVMDEFNIDGVYLDGTAHAYACRNILHGCGTVRKDGSVAPTFPFFSVRSAMRRIYTVVRSRKSDGQINVHNSNCMNIPALTWATSYWDGEQFAGLKRVTGPEFLPIDSFCTEFMGHQWGVPAEFLCYGKPISYREAWAITLLHDVPVRACRFESDLNLLTSIWNVMDEFGRKDAEWLPYWRNSMYVKVSPKGVYVSIYRHAQNGVLVVVSNLSHKRVQAELRLNLSMLRLQKKVIRMEDTMTNESFKGENGKVKCELTSLDWKMIWLKTK